MSAVGPDGVDVLSGGRQWLLEFEREHGRRLRVLHIGNIANNAYNNAKIQRDRGIDADVLSFDYYHIMACPEWEDSGFSGDVGDPLFPNWWAADLKGYRRPRWFVAGPLDACIRYLLASLAGKKSANWFWRALNFERWALSQRGRRRRWLDVFMRLLTGRIITYPGTPANALVLTIAGKVLRKSGNRLPLRYGRLVRWLRWLGRRWLRFGRTAFTSEDAPRHLRLMRHAMSRARARGERLLKEIGRDDFATDLDFFFIWWWHPYLSKLLREYDVIQAYATYTAMPFILGSIPYVAYEHGTIRTIPFVPTREGRMCMASYRAAAAVLVTNLDNLDAAERMQLDPRRIICLPHAFDSDKLERFAASVNLPRPGVDKVPTFVTPARQHWVDQDPGWAKGNDRVFAALRLLKDAGRYCVLRAVAWGNDVEASRRRISELGIEDMVEWLPTMKKHQLWLEYLSAHAVIDQFVVPAFGGITFEGMMFARRVITYVDIARAEQFFGVAPPLFNCCTAEEIACAMARVIDDPADSLGNGRACQEWMQRYHSADRIVALQIDIYRRLVAQKGAAARKPAADVERSSPVDEVGSPDVARMLGWLRLIQPFYVSRPWIRRTTGDEIVMLVVSALRIDPRVEREARVLAATGWRVRVIAPDISVPPHAESPIDWGPNVSFDLLSSAASEYILKAPGLAGEAMYQHAVEIAPFAFHCHDLNTALIGLRAAWRVGARLVCDFHEWSSENVTWNDDRRCWEPHSPMQRLLFRAAEKRAIRLADAVITVNHSIAEQLEALGRGPAGRVKVIRNIPSLDAVPTRVYPPLKRQLNLPDDAFVVLYQGGTGPTRLLEPIIEALAMAPEVILVIRGPSLDLFGAGYKALADKIGAGARLVLRDPVPSRDVVAAARGADAGVWTLPNLSLNFYYALPNKVFEYLAADMPILVANYPEPARLVQDNNVGLVFDPTDPVSIAAQMRRLARDPALAEQMRTAIPKFLRGIDAAGEWHRLAELYQQLRVTQDRVLEPA